MNENNQDLEDALYDGPSKSQIKRELLAIQELGRKIIALPLEKIKKLNLDEKILEEIKIAQKIKANGEGKRRQTAYVGKLLRTADIESIKTKLYEWENGSKSITAQMHMYENLRDRLIESDDSLTKLLETVPGVDIQQIRNLIRVARKEQTQNSKLNEGQEPQKKAYRALFQFIKTLPLNGENDE
ncbi:conserved uncharacterised protein [Taylorella equigenitalis 14/56]|uniref:Dual-action ribosomal maturation protein DarP n=3 Tax=Taylorella equigenitalis TaxID=29575 RepID=A0A654KFX7_TAYEM|nr:ribosome biogenesis factor YjgA [Taylorella equigenitalis]ADU91343.1 Putative alpha helix protein [Taylorella equigenitalis MCE9]AFN36438.1 hypothetical protein KUI_1389 [Taylorella equigenitalis ATCC 35865]ASY31006.1 hypothetical protein B9Z30_06565 [Taylorella equigenitalis]ASY39838.1 hypothetical protein CA604_06985 [Taylorella equigenitalis]ASY42774.1 hypothetical protein CA943_06695 [Taylorella equigenitalis]